MANKIKIHSGDVNGIYEPSDSENEYTEHEKSLLRKVRKGRQQNVDPQQELLAFQQEPSDDENDGEQYGEDDGDDDDDFEDKTGADSDIEDDADDGIPSDRAWGKKKRDFYATDFVDQDYSSYNAREEDLAEQEEAEARAIQQRLAKQMNEADFSLDILAGPESATPSKLQKKQKKADTTDVQQTYLKSDLSELSKRQQEQLFKKDSPEFESLVQDFQQRLEESRDVLNPILKYFKTASLVKHPLVEFVVTNNNLILNYCSNVAFYLVLKAKRVPVKSHPIVKRLVQMRQLLLQLEEKYTNVVRPQLEKLLSDIADGKEIEFDSAVVPKKSTANGVQRKKLGLVSAIDATEESAIGDSDDDTDADEEADDARTFNDKLAASDSDEADAAHNGEDDEMADVDERREITYQMMKNKGLTPYRKKELRNPRVKHRNKFRKALIRRKGAVRTVRKEIKRYDGEISGIKAGVKKGIQIK